MNVNVNNRINNEAHTSQHLHRTFSTDNIFCDVKNKIHQQLWTLKYNVTKRLYRNTAVYGRQSITVQRLFLWLTKCNRSRSCFHHWQMWRSDG